MSTGFSTYVPPASYVRSCAARSIVVADANLRQPSSRSARRSVKTLARRAVVRAGHRSYDPSGWSSGFEKTGSGSTC
jgi:hypothetical protein